MRCPACGGETPEGKRFCKHCGASLAAACPACGVQLEPDDRFCVDCGTPIRPTDVQASPQADSVPESQAEAPASSKELRHVSVLFCDLVGFTPLSEKRDPEEVRDLLSGYFELAGDRRSLRRRRREIHRRCRHGRMGSTGRQGG